MNNLISEMRNLEGVFLDNLSKNYNFLSLFNTGEMFNYITYIFDKNDCNGYNISQILKHDMKIDINNKIDYQIIYKHTNNILNELINDLNYIAIHGKRSNILVKNQCHSIGGLYFFHNIHNKNSYDINDYKLDEQFVSSTILHTYSDLNNICIVCSPKQFFNVFKNIKINKINKQIGNFIATVVIDNKTFNVMCDKTFDKNDIWVVDKSKLGLHFNIKNGIIDRDYSTSKDLMYRVMLSNITLSFKNYDQNIIRFHNIKYNYKSNIIKINKILKGANPAFKNIHI